MRIVTFLDAEGMVVAVNPDQVETVRIQEGSDQGAVIQLASGRVIEVQMRLGMVMSQLAGEG